MVFLRFPFFSCSSSSSSSSLRRSSSSSAPLFLLLFPFFFFFFSSSSSSIEVFVKEKVAPYKQREEVYFVDAIAMCERRMKEHESYINLLSMILLLPFSIMLTPPFTSSPPSVRLSTAGKMLRKEIRAGKSDELPPPPPPPPPLVLYFIELRYQIPSLQCLLPLSFHCLYTT